MSSQRLSSVYAAVLWDGHWYIGWSSAESFERWRQRARAWYWQTSPDGAADWVEATDAPPDGIRPPSSPDGKAPATLPDVVEETGQAPACMMGFAAEARRGAELYRERLLQIRDIVAWLRTQPHREDTGEDPGRRIDGCEPRQRSDWFPSDGLNCWERALHFIAWQIVQFGTSENYEIRDSYLLNNERHIFIIDKRTGRDLSFDIMPSGAQRAAANALGDDAGDAFGQGAVQGALEALGELGSDEADAGEGLGGFSDFFGGDAGAGAEAAARGAALGALEGWSSVDKGADPGPTTNDGWTRVDEPIAWDQPGEPAEASADRNDRGGDSFAWSTTSPESSAAPARESSPATTWTTSASTSATRSQPGASAPSSSSLASTIGSSAASAFKIADGLLQRFGLVPPRTGPDFTIEHRIDAGKWLPYLLIGGLAVVAASGKDKS